MLQGQARSHPLDSLVAVATVEEVRSARSEIRAIAVERTVAEYIVRVCGATREHPSVALGVSPRGGILLYRMAQARAWAAERSYVTPDDVKHVSVPVLAHRLVLEARARYGGTTGTAIVEEVLRRVPVPV